MPPEGQLGNWRREWEMLLLLYDPNSYVRLESIEEKSGSLIALTHPHNAKNNSEQ